MTIAFAIWSIIVCIFFAIGISCRKSQEPVGFFAFSKPPVVEDVEGYNKAVAKLWFVVGIVYEIIGIPILFLEQNSPLFLPILFAVIIEIIVMMIAYLKIEKKYRK